METMKTNSAEFHRKIIFKKPELFEEYFNIYYPMVNDNLDEKNSEIINDNCSFFRREVKTNSTWIKCFDRYFEIYPTNKEAMKYQIILETFMPTLTWFLISLNKEKINDDDYSETFVSALTSYLMSLNIDDNEYLDKFKTYITENDALIRKQLMETMGIEE